MTKDLRLGILFACLLFICLPGSRLTAVEYYSEDFGYTLKLPTGWYVQDEDDSTQVFFANKAGDAGVLVGVFEYEPDVTNATLLKSIVDRMHMTGKHTAVAFNSFKAVRGNYRFQSEGLKMSADLVIFNTSYYFFMLMGTSLAETAAKNKTSIEKVLASFSYTEEETGYDEEDTDEEEYAVDEDGKSATTKNDFNYQKDGTGQEYLIDIDWGDYINKFSFRKSDYYSAISEGEAIIKSGNMYAYYKIDTDRDPDYSETFWARFYQDMYNKNYMRVGKMVEWFRGKAKAEGWSAYELAEQVVKCAQVIPYERPYNVVSDKDQAANTLDYFTPNEIAWYNKGDCDTKSMLLVMLLRQLGYEAVIYYSSHYEHAMAGVNVNGSGTYKLYKNRKYYFIESTYPGWNIGDLPPDFEDPNYWTLVPIK